MEISKQYLIQVVQEEIDDRSVQADESGTPEDYTGELEGLQFLLKSVSAEASLSYQDYEWLSYLVANKVEMEQS